MTLEMAVLLGVLAVMAVLFFTEKLPVELTAFLGLVFLTLTGYVTAGEAFTGFASPAVITMLSIFFVSAALLHTGVADVIASRVHRVIGNREVWLVIAIMVVAGVLSAFMNNIAAVAVLLPAVASIARKTGIAPSRLFMPLSFGAILGGTTTLVGTPPNILAGDLLRERGLETFSLFDFTPLGLVLLGVGVLYMITVGRWLLPRHERVDSAPGREDLTRVYHLSEALFGIRVPAGSQLEGRTLGESRLGTALGVQVVGIMRGGKKQLAPGADTVLRGDDVLLVEGPHEQLQEALRVQGVEIGEPDPDELGQALGRVRCVGLLVVEDSSLAGRTLRQLAFRERFGVVVVGIRRGEQRFDSDLASIELQTGDVLVALGAREQVDAISAPRDLLVAAEAPGCMREMGTHAFLLRVHAGSPLVGRTIRASRLGERMGLTVAGILRGDEVELGVGPRTRIHAGDQLLVIGEADRIRHLLAIGDVQLEQDITDAGLESDDVGLVEVTLAPRSHAVGRTLAQIDFRDRFGLQVLAIWSRGQVLQRELSSHRLEVGDAMLVQGSWSRIRHLGTHADFVVLTPSAQEARRTRKAPVAIAALVLMVAMVVTGFQPIHVAAFTAASFVALFGAITMEEAYRSVEWKAIFLVAAILPVGIAIERTGAAALVADTVTASAGPLGPYGVLAGLVLLASTLSQCLDGAPAVVLMAPIVLPTAEQLGISPHTLMMAVALAASAAFMTPFSHKANLLVMGAGGYKVWDYLRVGTPLTIVLLALMVLLVPLFFPF